MSEVSKRHSALGSTLATDERRRVSRLFAAVRHSVGWQLLGSILLFSACVTLVLTLLQLYLDYRRDVSALEARLEQISGSYLDSLAEGLWTLDQEQLRLQLTGILRLPDIRAVEVRDAVNGGDHFTVKVGERSSDSSMIAREYPLHHDVQGQDRVIGTLYVEATLTPIYRTLFDRALTILFGQAAEIFLVSLFIIYIFHYLFTRHLFAIAGFVSNYRITDPPPHLRLRRRPRQHQDELERVVTAFNALSDDLQSAYGSVRDANDQLQRDGAVLREREAKIRRLVDANIVGVFIWDVEGRIIEANDAFLNLVGYTREDLACGRLRWTDLTPAEWLDRDLHQFVPELTQTGSLQPFEKEYFRKDGTRVPVLIGVATFEGKGNQGVAFALDLTERKRAEEEQRYHIQLLKTVTDNASSALYIVDSTGLGTFINPSLERITGYRAEDLIGQVVHDKIHHTRPDGTPYPVEECPLTGAVRLRTTMRGEDLFVRKDGTFFPVRYTASPIFRDGAAVGTVIEVQDLTNTRAAEAELRSRAKLLSLAHDAIIVRDAESRITFWNSGAVKTYGWTAEEAVGRVSHDLLQTRFPGSWRAVEVTLSERGEWEGELTHITRQGTAIVVTSRQSLQRDEHGAGAAILEINRDITERKQAEEALRESEEKWRAVFENNPTMYFMVDAAGTILSVNPFGAEQLGYTVEELTGASVLNIFHDIDRATVQQNTTRCLEQFGQSVTWELRKVHKNGSILWVRETARAMLMKGRPVVLIVCEDITQRKRAEHLTGQVFETSPDAICVVDRDYRYQRVNPVFERTWGMPAERVVGRHVADLVGTEAFEQKIKPNYDRCFGGEEVSYTDWFTDSRGRLYVAVTYSPLQPNSERVEAALVIARDLTDHMLASEALRAAQAEVAHVNRVTTMGQLTASIAHEVNQPIAAAVTNAAAALRWLGTQPPDLEEVRQALSRIVENGTRAGDVISRIRSLIKKAPPRKIGFDLNEAVLEVIALTRSEMLRHGVSLQTQLAEGLLLIEADRIQLQQVVLNLIMNAVEAMSGIDEGTRELVISAGKDASSGVLVTVGDSGPGLDPLSVDRLFEAFFTTKPDGMGMGLAICRSIIEAHGGRLWATANEPRGAVFQFTIPADPGSTS